MTPELIQVDVSGVLEPAAGAGRGVSQEHLDEMVALGRRVHDDLLLARARGQVGFGDLYMLGREAMRAREAAESLAPRFENVAVLAQGAEAEVSSAVLASLAHPWHNLLPRAGRAGRPRVFLVDSVDAESLGAFLDAFTVEQTLLIVMSKRGSDLAPLLHYGVVRDILRKRLGPGFQDHLVVVTDAKGGTLREESLREGLLSFEIPSNVPSRFAALTPVGLLPAAMAGIDVRGVLAGAHAAAERTAGEDLRTNPAYQLPAALRALATRRGRRLCVFASCFEALGPTASHLARMYEESLGGPAGAEAGPRVSCTSAVVPRDAVRLANLALARRDELVVVWLDVARSARDRPLPKDAPGLSSLAGRPLSDAASIELGALRRVLAEEGVPYAAIHLPALLPNAIGALHMTCMLGAAFAAGLAGTDVNGGSAVERLRRNVDELLARPRA